MKIAILTSGILPVPAVKGGAVENLIDYYMAYNDRHHLHDITVYSVWDQKIRKHPARKSKVNHYRYINTNGIVARIWKKIFRKRLEKGYYHYTIEYFCDQVINDLRKRSYDLILLENRPAFALKIKKHCDASIIYHLHNAKLDKTIYKAKEIYDAANMIITVSEYITGCVKSIQPDETKCITVHNGINLDSFNYQTATPIKREEYGLSPNDFILLFSGRITKEKGIMQLIQALNQLKEYANIKLLILGSTFYGNNSYKGDFTDMLINEANEIQDRVFFTGFVPYHQIPNYLAMSDIAVIPSVWDDPFPTTVLEAQAMGKPIITTRRGGIPEEVSEDNAILLDTNEHFVDNLTAAILNLYEHPEKRKKMGEASAARSKMFDKETYARNFFKALDGI